MDSTLWLIFTLTATIMGSIYLASLLSQQLSIGVSLSPSIAYAKALHFLLSNAVWVFRNIPILINVGIIFCSLLTTPNQLLIITSTVAIAVYKIVFRYIAVVVTPNLSVSVTNESGKVGVHQYAFESSRLANMKVLYGVPAFVDQLIAANFKTIEIGSWMLMDNNYTSRLIKKIEENEGVYVDDMPTGRSGYITTFFMKRLINRAPGAVVPNSNNFRRRILRVRVEP